MLKKELREPYKECVENVADLVCALLDVKDAALADRIIDIIERLMVAYHYFLIVSINEEKSND